VGTDIHLYIEQKRNGAWICIPPPERDLKRWPYNDDEKKDLAKGVRLYRWGPSGSMRYYECLSDYDQLTQEEIPCAGITCQWCMGTGRDLQWYSNRNYACFGILAGVRNSDVPMIASPRGVPRDASKVIVDHHSWDHTPSWLTLDEILKFNWSQRATHSETVAEECPDFLLFVSDLIEPLCPDDYHEQKSVVLDHFESETGTRPSDFSWAGIKIKEKAVRVLRTQTLKLARDTRLVFGFDS